MGRCWCQSLIVYYGLTAHVKALDIERKKPVTLDQSIAEAPSPTSRSSQVQISEALRVDVEDEESRLARDLLLDCEAAISALFASSGVNEDNGMDSDLSGAEDEPIPPSPSGAPQIDTEQKNLQDTVEVNDVEASSSTQEEVSALDNSGDQTEKKSEKKKRGSKLKSVVSQTMKKAKKKKKHKGKPELKNTYSTSTPTQSKPDDTSTFTPELELSTPDADTNSKPLTKRTMSAARKSKSVRLKARSRPLKASPARSSKPPRTWNCERILDCVHYRRIQTFHWCCQVS
ncbi:Sugar transport protein 7 [Phytophthora nicotianae]|uniref:Sugar transport protein 7 n=1 Tax=Phytophthora nicotianae TaxID=4792 RepID=A0A0W8DEG7_PHYNI|nr:Sugar transport protein 7 [Phytophthora nicotianae]